MAEPNPKLEKVKGSNTSGVNFDWRNNSLDSVGPGVPLAAAVTTVGAVVVEELATHRVIPGLDLLNNVLGPLIVAVLTGLYGWLFARIRAKQQVQRRVDAAPRAFVEELDQLISRAWADGEENAIVNARAIVAVRDTLRSSLTAISGQLNSEIDHLADDLGISIVTGPSRVATGNEERRVSAKEAFETICVLHKIWPAKRRQIEVELRKLMAELGLDFRQLG